MEIDIDIEIGRPREEVFGYLTDPARLGEWQVQTVRVETLDNGPVRTGTRLREVRRLLGREVAQVAEVVQHEPPRAFALRVDHGPMRSAAHHVLEASDPGATRLQARLEAHPRGPARLLAPLVRLAMGRLMRGHYRRLKSNLEGGFPSTSSGSAASGPVS